MTAEATTSSATTNTTNNVSNAETTESAPIKEVSVDLRMKDITSEQFAEMVANEEVPKNVTHLDISHNQILDLSPLSELKNLTVLDLDDQTDNNTGGQPLDLLPLIGLTNLKELHLVLVFIEKICYNITMRYTSDLTDPQWEMIKEFFPAGNKSKYEKREIVNAVMYLVDNDCKWRNLPKDFRIGKRCTLSFQEPNRKEFGKKSCGYWLRKLA